MTPGEFSTLTPFEFFEWLRERMKAQVEDYKRVLWGAWHTALFTRQKKLPELEKMIKNFGKKQPKKQPPALLWQNIRLLNNSFGGTEV